MQDKSGNKIVNNVLQAKAYAHAQRAGQHGELVQLHPAGVDREKEDQQQQQVVQHRGEQLRQAARQMKPAEEFLAEEKADRAGYGIPDQQDHEKAQHAAQGDARRSAGDMKVEHIPIPRGRPSR